MPSSRKLQLRVDPPFSGERLDRWLAAVLPAAAGEEVSRRRIRRLIEAGAVYLDGQRLRVASRAVRAAARVEVHLGPEAEGSAVASFELTAAQVLFEDQHLIAFDKPSGIASQATVDDAVDHLYAAARRFLARRDGSAPYLALHHRLDRPTSGVLLLAKNRRVNAALAAAFAFAGAGAGAGVSKLYHALVWVEREPPSDAWSVRNRLARRPRGQRGMRVVEEGGREAVTDFRVVRRLGPCRWVEALPRTGRTHQVRVHLAGSGLPILGDRLYGAPVPEVRAPRLMLHAARLELEHPESGASLVIESPPPEDFRALLDELASPDR